MNDETLTRLVRVAEWYEGGPKYPVEFEEGRQRIASDLREALSEITRLRERVGELEGALATCDVDTARCPFQKPSPPPRSKPCSRCGASASETCRVAVTSAFDFVDKARTLLKDNPNER